MALQRDVAITVEVTSQSKKIIQVMEEAYRMVSELAIIEEELVEFRIRKLATWLHDTQRDMVQVQLELNLQITELQLRAQPSTPPEVKEQ